MLRGRLRYTDQEGKASANACVSLCKNYAVDSDIDARIDAPCESRAVDSGMIFTQAPQTEDANVSRSLGAMHCSVVQCFIESSSIPTKRARLLPPPVSASVLVMLPAKIVWVDSGIIVAQAKHPKDAHAGRNVLLLLKIPFM